MAPTVLPDTSALRADLLTAAPYSLVRITALERPGDGPDAARHRALLAGAVAALGRAAELGGPLADALGVRAAVEDTAVDRRVVLALRRDVHNRRAPRPALRAALGGLPERVVLLRDWLDARDDAERLLAEAAAATPAALAADRRVLAAACREEPLRRAVTVVGQDLLRAVDRAAALGDAPDSRARKSEATVLRYVLRAATRTVPLSWFCHVGWGRWSPDGAPDAAAAVGTPIGSAQPQRGAVAELLTALLTGDGWAQRPHHLAPDLRTSDGQAVFRRSRPGHDSPGGPVAEVRLALTGPLRHVLRRAAQGSVPPAQLAREIGDRLPSGAAPGAADAYVAGLVAQGLLRPDLPVAPQDPDPLRTLARVAPPVLAGSLRRIDAATRALPALPAGERPAALAALRQEWAGAYAAAGATATPPRTPVTEDVVVPGVAALGRDAGAAAVATLTRLTPLFELLDTAVAHQAAAADHLVARYGVGGRCPSVALFAQDAGELWRRAATVSSAGALRPDPGLGPRLVALAAARARFAALLPDPSGDGTGPDADVVLTDAVVDAAASVVPRWVRTRPVSYSVFALPLPGGGLCVNRVYGGWGRFTSRFLDRLPPSAADDVRDRLRATLPPGGRGAQVRPVGGFNGNLHPRLLDDEVADGPWGTVRPQDVHVVHDAASDRVRLRHARTGELLDVLYLGFLVPIALPGHLGPLLDDLASGLVDPAAALGPGRWTSTAVGRVHVRPRVRHRDVVLARRSWRLPAAVADALRGELAVGVTGAVVARWRAALGLPEQVFVSSAAAPAADAGALDSLVDRMGRPRSQLVDLGSALHLRCLGRTLAGHPGELVLEEALPVPPAGRRVTEVVVETHRGAP
jgi:hypothetical protein